MPVSKLTKSTRFIQPGVSLVYFLTTAANYDTLTRTELDAGTDISGELAAISGWSTTSNAVQTPDMASRFTPSISGMITADDSSLNFYASKDGQDARTLFPRDTTGFMCFLDSGDTPNGTIMDVFPVSVSQRSLVRSLTDPLQVAVSFVITDVPSEGQTIPTV